MKKLWRLRAVVLASGAYNSAPDGGLPETVEFFDRITPQVREYHGLTIAFAELPETLSSLRDGQPGLRPVQLIADVPASDSMEALAAAEPLLETVIDLMSFEMGSPLALGQVELTDISPPAEPGEEREFNLWALAPFGLNARTVDMGGIQGRLIGQLPESVDLDSRQAAALRWFVKSLSTNLLHDQFIFLWIALEVILDDDAEHEPVLTPYRAPCGHEIFACPECDRPTESLARGATIRSFLEGRGVEEVEAKQLWKMRQMMHGAIPFDSKKLDDLAVLVQRLRAVVAGELKSKLGLSAEHPPFVSPSGPAIHPAMGAGGTSKLDEEDLRPLIPDRD